MTVRKRCKGGERDKDGVGRDREISICLFTPQMPITSGSEPGRSQDPGASTVSPMWMARKCLPEGAQAQKQK